MGVFKGSNVFYIARQMVIDKFSNLKIKQSKIKPIYPYKIFAQTYIKLMEIPRRYEVLVRVNMKLLHGLSYRSRGMINAHIYSQESGGRKLLLRFSADFVRITGHSGTFKWCAEANVKRSQLGVKSLSSREAQYPRSRSSSISRGSFPGELANEVVIDRPRGPLSFAFPMKSAPT